MNHDSGNPEQNWMTRLVEEMGRAAQTGNAQTARLIALLMVTAGAVGLIVLISR